MSNPVRVKELISTEWVEYADYDNRRSLPHIMDGLKITQRKVMYTAMMLPKGDKPIKVSQFSAKAAEVSAYHHGDVSMAEVVVKLAQNFPGTNNFPWLEKHGQFGSILSKDSSAPRYIHTRLHSNWDTFFKKEDREIVESLYDDGEKIEPKYYIPTIPTILLNGSEGVGNGYSTNIFNYSLPSIIKACQEIVKHGKVRTPLIPHLMGWKGKVEKNGRQIVLSGTMKIINTTKIEITELPPKYDNEKYKKFLNKLVDSKFIKDYKNKSTEDGWHWIIDCPRDTVALGMDTLMEKFGLISKMTENFVCWGMDATAPITFESPESLVEYWFDERLKLYQKSILNQISNCKDDITKADLRMKFIKWCLKNDFRKLSRKEFIEKSVNGVKNLPEELAGEFVAMPMYRITTDEVDKLGNEIDNILDYLDELEALTPKILMDRNLKEIKI